MLSPAAQHRNGTRKERAEMPAPAASAHPASEDRHEPVIVAQFKADKDTMSHIKSRTRRIVAKRQALARYQQWLDAFPHKRVFEKADETMFVWLLLWHIDAGEWQRGLELARFALPSGMLSPLDFNRTLAETVCEEIAGGILNAGATADHADLLDDLAQLVEGCDMTDQITAKLHKARALARLDTDPEQARQLLATAEALDPKSGVKRHLKALTTGDKPASRKAADDIQAYSLSGRAAAAMANMTAPAFIRHAKKYPELLPRLEIPVGTRHLYRFNPKHVKAYLKNHLVNARKDTNP